MPPRMPTGQLTVTRYEIATHGKGRQAGIGEAQFAGGMANYLLDRIGERCASEHQAASRPARGHVSVDGNA